MIHTIVRMSSTDHVEIECSCGWAAFASNPIPLFDEWHLHLLNVREEANDG